MTVKTLSMRLTGFIFSLAIASPAFSSTQLDPQVRAKILESGVPETSLNRILDYLAKNEDQIINVPAYSCTPDPKDKATFNPEKPCEQERRTRISAPIKITWPHYAVVIDYSRPSTEKRLMLIDMATGTVEKFLAAHGKGSGDGLMAVRFSNKDDSKMTSLGLYRAGGIYDGKDGTTIRLYGLERSNDLAFWRDIVMHGAWYAQSDFITKTNPNTKQPYNRLGVSWGCPAVDPALQKRLLQILPNDAIYDFYYPDLMEMAQSGGIVNAPGATPSPTPTAVPTPAPEPPQAQVEPK